MAPNFCIVTGQQRHGFFLDHKGVGRGCGAVCRKNGMGIWPRRVLEQVLHYLERVCVGWESGLGES